MDSKTRRSVANTLLQAAAALEAPGFDWMSATPEEFEKAVQDKVIGPDDLYYAAQMCDRYGWKAEGLAAAGINPALAEAFASGTLPLEDYVDSASRADQAATAKFIAFWDKKAMRELDAFEEPRNLEYYFDRLLAIANEDPLKVQGKLWDILEEEGYPNLNKVSPAIIEEAATNPNLYSIQVNKDRRDVPNSVAFFNVGYMRDSIDVQNTELAGYVSAIGQSGLDEAFRELRKTQPRVEFEGKHMAGSDFVGKVYYRLVDSENWHVELVVDADDLLKEVDRLLGIRPPAESTGEREVILEVTKEDLKNLGIGKSRVLEEAPWKLIKLRPEDLEEETRMMKHCVGNKKMGYVAALRRGQIQIWSLRDRKNLPQFTLEVENDASLGGDGVKQLKGKANRTPGFASVHSTDIHFPEEVALWNFIFKKLHINPKKVVDFQACRLPEGKPVTAAFKSPRSFDEPFRP